jgi:hypothetical protein
MFVSDFAQARAARSRAEYSTRTRRRAGAVALSASPSLRASFGNGLACGPSYRYDSNTRLHLAGWSIDTKARSCDLRTLAHELDGR